MFGRRNCRAPAVLQPQRSGWGGLQAKRTAWGGSNALPQSLDRPPHLPPLPPAAHAVLEWIRDTLGPRMLSGSACSEAAAGGHLLVLQWLKAQGVPWDAHTTIRAAQGGHLAVLQWTQQQQQPPCPLDMRALEMARQKGHVAVEAWVAAALRDGTGQVAGGAE